MIPAASSGPIRRGLSAKMRPTASAPAAAATRAHSGRVIPQIFTRIRTQVPPSETDS